MMAHLLILLGVFFAKASEYRPLICRTWTVVYLLVLSITAARGVGTTCPQEPFTWTDWGGLVSLTVLLWWMGYNSRR